ncbi:hypothetical protein IJ541_01725 [bacterium]|nr:hypothetical protein [bacterium]
MESMNKFKVLTIIVICMFLFVVAAIYSNTKDATQGKMKNKEKIAKEQLKDDLKTQVQNGAENSANITDLRNQLNMLNQRIDDLSTQVNNSGSQSLNCRIYGSLTGGGIEQLSPEAAIQEARVNNNEIIIACSL